jgi:RimJ/RimL family protein N-acetyltransferase
VIATKRLSLRIPRQGDAQDLAERRSDPSTAIYQAWTVPYSLEKAQEWIAEVSTQKVMSLGYWSQLIVERTDDGRVVGDVATHLSENGKTAEIGYTLHRWARGQGYATEAAVGLCTYLVETVRVHRLQATTHPHNATSIAVLKRLGFTAEGIQRESFWVGETVTDNAMFGLLARDWLPPVQP